MGPTATPSQVLNAQLATCLYHCFSRLEKLQEEYLEGVLSYIRPSIQVNAQVHSCQRAADTHVADCTPAQNLKRSFERIIDPLLAAIRRELGAIIAKLHHLDFSDTLDPLSAMGGGPSLYMKDLVEKMTFVKAEILSQFNVLDLSRHW